MSNKRIIYYTSKEGCKPCADITKLVEAGQFQSPDTDEVDVVDITTDEGYQRFYDEILSKQDGAVPSAYFGGKKCQIMIEKEMVYFECPSNDLPATPDEKSLPPETAASHDASPPGLPSEPLPLQS